MAESQTLFRFSQVLPLYIFLSQGPIQDLTLHFLCMAPYSLLVCDSATIFSCFSWPLNLRFYLVFSHALLGLWIWGKTTEVKCPLSLHPVGSMMSTRLSGGCWPGGTPPVISWLSVGLSFPHRKVPFSPLCTFFWSIEGSIIVRIYDMSNMASSSKPS